ncbi:MAG: hypothetical protein AB8H47_19545 [Bacteroidia bacterium]
MKSTTLLFYVLGLTILNIHAQDSGFDQFSSYYESILAKSHQYESSQWSLSGSVASMKVWEYTAKNERKDVVMMSYQFDERGYLLFWMKGDSSQRERYFEHRTFSFGEDDKLPKTTQYDYHQNSYTLTKTFDEGGYLSKIIYHSDDDSTLNFTTEAQYSDEHSSMRIKYNYETEASSWERRVNENYQFSFDRSGFLIEEKMQGRYAYQKTFKREAKTGQILKSHHLDLCFPSNSCVNLIQEWKYDRAGNLIKLSSQDLTVRNSLWTLGDDFEATYNEQNLIIEKRIRIDRYLSSLQSPTMKFKYEYIFDERGNWIKRTEYTNGQAGKVIERELTYR